MGPHDAERRPDSDPTGEPEHVPNPRNTGNGSRDLVDLEHINIDELDPTDFDDEVDPVVARLWLAGNYFDTAVLAVVRELPANEARRLVNQQLRVMRVHAAAVLIHEARQ